MIERAFTLFIVLVVINTSCSERAYGYFQPGYGPQQGRQNKPQYNNHQDDVEWIGPPKQGGRNGKFVLQPPEEFSYSKQGGPDNWRNIYPECGQYHQSPINLAHAHSQSMPPLQFDYYFDNQNQAEIKNTGKVAEVKMLGNQGLPQLSGGPLNDVYELVGLHFHWGSNDYDGSEHMIGGVQFTMEAHVVHFKKAYNTLEEAQQHADGLAVVSFLLQVSGENFNKDFQRLVSRLPNINQPESSTRLPLADAFRWFKSRVDDNYFTYPGSLTTPPCSEVVTWIVFQKPITIGAQQVTEFRRLRSKDNVNIDNNHRRAQNYRYPNIFFVRGVH